MKKILFTTNRLLMLVLPLLLVIAIGTNVQAQSGIYESYAILNINGGGNAFYDLNAATGNPDFNGTNLGSFSGANTLVLNGAQNKTFKCNPCDVTNGNLWYRIYPTSGTAGAFIQSGLFFGSNLGTGCNGNDQLWEATAANINVLSGLSPGNYTLEVYTTADYQGCGTGTNFANNTGANYKATFNYCGSGVGALAAGTYNIPGCFPTIQAAATYLNTNGVAGAVVFNVGANGGAYTETAAAGGIQFNVISGASATNTITFQKHPSATSVTVTAVTTQTAGSLTDAVIKLVGSDYMVFDAINVIENTGNTVITSGTNTKIEFGYALLATSTTDGCQNNIIRNCNINLGTTAYQNMFGIYSACTHSSTSNATTQTASSAAGVNSNNTFTGNTITNVVYGVGILMPPTTATLGTINTSITNNNITIIGAVAAPATFVNWSGTTRSSGVDVRNATGLTITGNTIAQSGAITTQLAGIEISHGTAPAGVTYTYTLSSNNITLTQTGTTGLFGIDLSNISNSNITTGTVVANSNTINLTVNTTANGAIRGIDLGSTIGTSTANLNTVNITTTNSAASANSISGVVVPGKLTTGTAIVTANTNTITIAMTQSAGAQSGAIQGLILDAVGGATTTAAASSNIVEIRQTGAGTYSGAVNYIVTSACANLSVTNNTCRTNAGVLATTGTTYGISHSNTYTASVAVNSNVININRTGGTGTFIGIYTNGGTGITSNYNINSNAITMTAATSGTFTGIQNTDGGTPTKSFSNNTISMTGTASGTTKGYTFNFGSVSVVGGAVTINNAATNIMGVDIGNAGSSLTGVSVTGLTISLTSSGVSPTMYGINTTHTSTAFVHNITNNTISTISATAAAASAPTLAGIRFTTGTSNVVTGNTITGFSTGTGTGNSALSGILMTGGTTPIIARNNIYGLSSSCSGTSSLLSGISIQGGTTTIDINNNLVSGLTQTTASRALLILGINCASTVCTYRVYNNTVVLGTTATPITNALTDFGACALGFVGTANTTLCDARNNILWVSGTARGAGGVACVMSTGATTGNTVPPSFATTSNNNIYYVNSGAQNYLFVCGSSTANFTNGYALSGLTANGTTNIVNDPNFNTACGLYKSFITGGGAAGRENATFTENNLGAVTPPTAGGFAPSGSSYAENGAQAITTPSITTDFNANSRTPTNDIGAIQFAGTAVDAVGPSITYTQSPSGTAVCTYVTTTITDNSGVNNTAGLRPRLYFRRITGGLVDGTAFGNYPTDNNSTFNGWKYVETASASSPYSFDFNYALLQGGTVANGDVIQYFVAAQDLAGTPNVGFASPTISGGCPSTVNFANTLTGTATNTFTYGSAGLSAGLARAWAPQVVTGFTADVIANGVGTPSTSATATFDNATNYALDATYLFTAGGAPPAFALPTSGVIRSQTTPGLAFQLQSSSANNSLRINSTTPTALTFTTPISTPALSILAASGDGSNTFTFTVTYTDATTEVFAGNAVADWFNGTPIAVQGIGRVSNTNTQDGVAINPRLYEYTLALSAANYAKQVQSVTFTRTAGTSTTNFMAISAATPTAYVNCVNNTSRLTVYGATASGVTYQWRQSTVSGGPYTNAVGGTGATTTSYLTPALSAAMYYVCDVTCGATVLTSNEVAVSTAALPTVSVTPNSGAVCAPAGVLTASGASSYIWSPVASLSSTSVSVMKPTVGGVYNLTGTDANGCTASTTANITLGNAPFNLAATATPSGLCGAGNSALLATSNLSSPTSAYTFAQSTGTFTALAGGTNSAATGDDGTETAVNLGFTFNYNGTNYTQVTISTNGIVQMGGAAFPATHWTNDLSTGFPAILAPMWDDNNRTTGSISYLTTGTAPNRVFTIDWNNVAIGGSGATASATNAYQVQLLEGTNVVRFNYGSLTSANGLSASIGITGVSGNYLSVTPGSPGTASSSAANNAVSAVTNIPSGTVYTFTPAQATYSWSPATFLSATNIANPTVTAINTTTAYTVTATGSAGCTSTATATITVAPLTAGTASSNISVACGTASPTLTLAGSAGTIIWETSTDNFGVVITPTVVTTTTYSPGAITSTMYYRAKVSCGGSDVYSNVVTVTINPNPAASIAAAPSASVCVGTAVTLSANPASGMNYAWSGGLGSSQTASPTVNGTYTVTVTDQVTNCTATSSQVVTFNANPNTPTITPSSASICAGASVSLTANSDNTATASLGTASGTIGGNGNPYRRNVGASKLQVIYTAAELAAAGITANSTLTAASFNVTAVGGVIGSNFQISIGHTSSATFPSTTFLTGLTTVVTPSAYTPIIGANTHNFASGFVWNGVDNIVVDVCFSINDTGISNSTITTMPASTSSVLHSTGNNTTTHCSTSTTGTLANNRPRIALSFNPPATYAWSPAGTLTPNTGLGATVVAAPAATETYVVTVTNAASCTATSSVVVAVAPQAAGTASSNITSACASAAPTLTLAGSVGTIDWETSTDNFATVITSTGVSTATYAPGTITSTMYYRAKVTCGGSDVYSNVVTVTINANPVASISPSPSATVCSNQTLTLTALPASGVDYLWSGGLGTLQTATPVVSGTYRVTVTDQVTGCTATASQAVTVNPIPTSVTAGLDETICNGGSVNLASTGSVSGSPTIISEDFETGATGWTFRDTSSTGTSIANQIFHIENAPYTDASGSATFSNFAISGTKFAYANADAGGSGSQTRTDLISPTFSTIGYTGTGTLTFKHVYQYWGSSVPAEEVAVQISSNGGSTWTNLTNYNPTSRGTITNNAQAAVTTSVTIPGAFMNQSNVRFRFKYRTNWGYYWAIDDIVVQGTPVLPSFAWTSAPSGFTSAVQNPGLVSPTVNTTYTVTATNPVTGCTASASKIVTVTQPNVATISYAASPYCSNAGTASVTQTGTTGGTYSAGAGLSINATTGAVDLAASTAGAYTVTYSMAANGPCAATTTTASITITAAPSATISYGGSSYCANAGTASVTFSGTSGGTYSAGAGLSINATTGAVNLAASTAGTYTVTYTVAAAAGCSPDYTTTASITIDAVNAATISYAGSPYCSTSGTASVTFSGTTGGAYSAPAGLSINATTGAVDLAASTAGTYTVTYTMGANGACASATATTSITITATPSASISYAGSPYCSNAGTASVTQTGSTGGTYSAGAGLSINATTGAVNLATSTAGTYTVTYTVAAAGGCTPDYTTTASISIDAANAATITYAGSPFCTGGAVGSVSLTGTTGGTFSAPAGLTIDATTGAITPTTSTAGTYTVTYTMGANGVCSSATTTTSVTITSAPTGTISYTGSPYCSNAGTASVTQTGSTGGVYSSTGGLSLNTTTGAVDLAASTPGTYTVNYDVATANGCPAFNTSTTITITVAPSATISYAGSPYCSNLGTASVTFSGTTGGTYSAGAGLSINATTGAVNLAASTGGTYTVTYTVAAAGGCTPAYTTTASITVDAAPVVSVGGPYGPYCNNASAVTLNGTPAGGTWSGSGVTGTSFDPSAASIGANTLTYTAVNGSCSVSATTSVTVNTAPTVSAGGPYGPVCSNGSSITLTGAPAGGTWSGTGVTGSTFNPATASTGANILTYTYSDGTCSNTATTTVTVNAAPVVTAGTYGPVCENGANITLGGTPVGGTWSGTGVTGSTFNPATATAGTYTLTYSYSDGTCSNTATTSVTVNPTPIVTIPTSYGPYCANDVAVVLSATPAGGTWSGSGMTGASFNPATATIGSNTITYSYTTGLGCTNTTTTNITVNSVPVATLTAGTNVLACNSPTTTLTATGGTTYSWSSNVTSISGNTATAPGAGVYRVVVSDINGCAASAQTIITINSVLPVVAIQNTTGTSVLTCTTTTINLVASGGASYAWSGSLGTAATASVTAPGTASVTATAANGCTASTSVAITQNITNPSVVLSGATTICPGTTAVLTATSATATRYDWGAGYVTSNTYVVNAGGTYTVTVQGSNGCTASAQTTVSANTLPSISGLTTPVTLCAGATLNLTASTSGTPAASAVTWVGPSAFAASTAAITRSSMTATMSGPYIVTATNTCGSVSQTVDVTVSSGPVLTLMKADLCPPGTAGVTVTPSGSTVVWTNSSNVVVGTTLYIENLPTGTYTATVTDPTGCVATKSVTIN